MFLFFKMLPSQAYGTQVSAIVNGHNVVINHVAICICIACCIFNFYFEKRNKIHKLYLRFLVNY